MSRGHGAIQRSILEVLSNGPGTVNDVFAWWPRDLLEPPKRSVQRAIKRLHEEGEIERCGGNQRDGYLYRLSQPLDQDHNKE